MVPDCPLTVSNRPARNGLIVGALAPVPFLLATGDWRHEGVPPNWDPHWAWSNWLWRCMQCSAPRATKLIWDVGHPCYPHKVLTGRRGRIRTLRQEGGLSGFTKRAESAFDPFGAAHRSTSISAALGFTIGRDMEMETGDAIAVISDGSISAGMAYEALNTAGAEGRRLFVLLNDAEKSIAPPVGAMSKYLSGLYGSSPLDAMQKMAEGFEAALPGPLRDHARPRCDHARRARALVTGVAVLAAWLEPPAGIFEHKRMWKKGSSGTHQST